LGADLSSNDHATLGFDGQVIRQVAPRGNDGQIRALISTGQKEQWNHSPREDAYTFLYAFYETPYSQVVTQAKRFQAEPKGDQPGHTSVFIDCGTGFLSPWSFTFDFDDRWRLLTRRTYYTGGNTSRQLREKMAYSQYEAYRDASGETIWYPKRSINTLYLNDVPNLVFDYTIREAEFNVDIPDSVFEVEIPKDAGLYDKITGLGWLPPGTRPAALFPDEARRRRLLWVGAGVLAALAVVATAWVVHRRRQQKIKEA
jgi:hypothetical protein